MDPHKQSDSSDNEDTHNKCPLTWEKMEELAHFAADQHLTPEGASQLAEDDKAILRDVRDHLAMMLYKEHLLKKRKSTDDQTHSETVNAKRSRTKKTENKLAWTASRAMSVETQHEEKNHDDKNKPQQKEEDLGVMRQHRRRPASCPAVIQRVKQQRSND